MSANSSTRLLETAAAALAADYARFPENQTYSLYATDVEFRDPLNRVQGRAHFESMIGFLWRWFKDLRLELHELRIENNHIRTEWTMRWLAPLPWQPPIAVSGWSELTVNAAGEIQTQVDYWHCSRWELLQQHWPGRKKP